MFFVKGFGFKYKKRWIELVGAMVLFCFYQTTKAQVATYSFSESSAVYTALSSPSVAYTAPWDDHTPGSAFQATLGFDFVYDGITQTQCFISPNGYISFGVQPTANNYLPLSVATVFTNGGTISALGLDLIATTDNITYQTIGSAPNRTFVVQWSNVRRKSKTGNFNFQIRLNETSNTIEFSYGLCAPDDVTALNAQVGIRGASNNFTQRDVLNRLQSGVNTNAAWLGKTTNGTANSSTVRTSVTEYPNNGLKYTYTPSLPCTSPTAGPSSLVIGNTNVTSSSFVGNSFTAASPAPTNYLILRSLSNIPPTVTDLPNRTYWAVSNVISGIYTVLSVTNVTAFTQTGLTPNTTYYYWVIPYNAGCLGGPYYNLGAMISASKTTCIAAPAGLTASTVEGNSFTASWTAVTGATDYLLDVSTNSTFTALLPGFSGVSTTGSTSFVVSGLSSLTTYYFRVRAVGITCNVNSTTATCTTVCGAYNIPYFQNFDTTAVNSIPSCFTIADNNSDSNSWSTQNVQPASNPNALQLVTSSTTDSDDWFFTPGLSLTAGVTYRLKFKYNTQSAGIYSENLRVRLGTGASESNMNNTILDLSNLQNTVYQTTTVDFTPVANNVYYVGFQGYSFANQSKILIDDISIIVSPTCYEPNDLSIVSVNSNSAVIAWSASVPEPTDGYEVYVSTSNITPGFSVTPNATVGFGVTTATVSGLAPATLYYVWVRGNCSSSDKSIWSNIQTFSTDCASALPLIVTAGTLCGGGSASLQAIGSPGSIIEWYADSTGTTLLSTGSTFVTPTLSATTVYYAQSKAPGGLVSLGPISPSLQGGSLGSQTAQTLIGFSVTSATTLQSFDIYPMTAGQNGTIEIRNSVNVIVATYTYITNAAGGNTPQTIPLALDLAIGNYFLYFETIPASGLIGNIDNASYPYNSSIANINGNDYDNTFFFYAYNWKLSNICRSLFTPVTATVIASPVISFSGTSSTICKGESVGLITLTGADSYDTFAWNTTVGLSGNIATGFNFSPLITTNYILTASQSTGSLCSSVIAYTVVVKPDPPAIAIVPATVNLCEGAIQTLNANLDLSTQAVIFSEDFNAPTNSWNKINASVGGIVANAAWTLRPSPYPYSSSYWNITMSSNDVSQFYLTNSDAQGSPGTNRTLTYLESPSINLSGYTSATLSFFHFLRYIPGNKARVEVSSDGGSSWTIIGNYLSNQGSSSSFANATISMNAYVGLANVKIRFLYDATWDFGWAIDNVRITGNLAVEVTWNPPTALFFDAAATIPYIADTPTGTIYTKPTETTIYTGSVVGSNGCSASSSTNITVIPTPIAGVLSDSQSVCATWQATDLVLTGFSGGNIVRWEYANDSAFTIGLTSIANTNSILTTNEIGTFPGTRYYRVVIQNGTCPVVYSNFVSINYALTRWDGVSWSDGLPNSNTKVIFDCGASTFSSTGDIEACSIEVLSGNVVINSNHTLHVQNDVKVVGGTLTFENDASLVQVNSLNNLGLPFSNTGSITYKRISTPIKRLDYVYWSSPVFPQTLLSFSPSTALFFYYNPLITNWAYATTNVPMIPGKGYLVRAPDVSPFNLTTPNNFNGAFVGVPNTGDISLPIIGNANQFNLIGNPYPSALSADAFLSDATNTPLIDATIYLWTHNTPITNNVYNAGDYAMYNYVGGVGTGSQAINPGLNTNIPNGKIASGQGFFVKGLSSGNIVFKNSMRLTGNNDQFFRMTNQTSQNTVDLERHRFWLDVYNNQGAFKQTLVAYIQNATNAGMDRGFDGEMIDMGNVVMLYIPQEGKKLSIQGRALPFNQTDVVPLGFKSTVAGVYKIRLSNFDGLFNSQNIYLEDTQMNITHDLRSGDYEFSTPAGTFDDRFRIKFETETLSVGNHDLSSNEVVIFKNSEQSFVVNTGQFTMDSVKVFDVRGRLLDELNEINANQTIINVGLSNELILIQLKLQNGQIITKKVVK